MGKRGRIVAVIVAVVVLTGVVVVGHRLWQESRQTDFSRSLDLVPSETKRLNFTDWREVREALDVAEDPDPGPTAINDMMDRAYDADLSAASSIDESAAALQRFFGFSPATAEWEAFTQADDGAAMTLRMPDDFDFDLVRDRLEELGFTKPERSNGIWLGGIDLVAAIDPTITPELQFVAVLEEKGLVVSSDTVPYAEKAVDAALGKSKSLGELALARDVVSPLDEPAAALLWAGDFACTDLAMSQADEDAQDQAEALIAEAGKVSPLSGLVMAFSADRALHVSALFEDEDVAKENLRSRARLIVGEAPGRGGSFSDDLTLKSSRTEGSTVQLSLAPTEDAGFVLSTVDSGPVLFATC